MALTATEINYSQLSNCDTMSSGGTWTINSGEAYSDFYKEGSACLGGTLRTVGNNDMDFAPTSSVDLSGTKHLHIWFLHTVANAIDTDANGGIQFYVSDGTNTGYYYISGSTTYKGGWINLVVDLSRNVDAGTKPTMSAVTACGVRVVMTSQPKNVDNCWIDNFYYGDGLQLYGDISGQPFSLDDIAKEDSDTTNGWGFIREINGVYYLIGSLVFGDTAGTNTCEFSDESQVVIFENRKVNSALYTIKTQGNSTNPTEFQIGSKSGTQGISGCIIRTQDLTQTPKFTMDLDQTNVDIMRLYGSVIQDASAVDLPTSATNREVLNCAFEACGPVTVSTIKFENCNVISADTDGVVISSTSHGVKNSNFISATDSAWRITAEGSYNSDGNKFTGNAYDIENANNATLRDSYSESNQDSQWNLNNTYSRAAQRFTGAVNRLTSATFYIRKQGSPTGSAYVKLYASEGDIPTGSVLATSKAFDVSTLTTSFALKRFEFAYAQQYTMTTDNFWISLEYTNGDASNYVQVGLDQSSPSHGGHMVYWDTGWNSDEDKDLCFYVYVEGEVAINALNGSDPSTSKDSGTPPGVTDIINSVTLQIKVKNSAGANVVGAQVSIHKTSDGTELMNEATNASGVASEAYNYLADTPIYWRVRKSSASPKYIPASGTATITSSGLDITVTIYDDAVA